MQRQLILDLPVRTSTGRDDFFVTPTNEEAVVLVDSWPCWPAPAVALVGPPGSGKSHLGDVWATLSGANKLSATDIDRDAVPGHLAAGALVIEDAPGERPDEAAIFHLLNLARETQSALLFIARSDPAHWQVGLADLRTRLVAIPVVRIGAPDDALMRAVIVKQFQDRQINVDETVVSYMLARMERSLEAVGALVAEIDRRALVEKTRITRTFVARIMAEGAEPDLFGND